MTLQVGLCLAWSETQQTGFLGTRLLYSLLQTETQVIIGSGLIRYGRDNVCSLNCMKGSILNLASEMEQFARIFQFS